ncbi:hypothetical protein [Campylobacter hyointestinalis]|uniref:hypothetical protein n=1 Tax=Campylobacter hyointestinalis TaxID=198 RepID=UPI000DCE03C1|nr:hypothetical protein [Campylobacter hyointestinalis]RAZ37176.1 hypothetical protein CHL9426_09340 [Campylobacter hyointestinalis subsp. lawsonii]RAZ53402.1 hypothetical protein CHL10074_09350 [Campylobacter hyointestinalis subsp. lawsonii]RAZ62064.1 hypothetical protein CHL9767_09335 [Campylobacter hyointestinalis subsp. lawsonii]
MTNLVLDTNKLVDDYKRIEATIISENSIFDKTIKYLENSFNDKSLAPKDKITIQSNLMSQMAVNLTAKALETALSWQQTKNQIELSKQELALKQQQTNAQKLLSDAEIEFNKARTALVTAQTATEAQKKNAVIREIASYDDQKRIKEAEIIANAVFGYASGGVQVPSDLQSRMLTTIDRITPNE